MKHLVAFTLGIAFFLIGVAVIFHLRSVPWGAGLMAGGALLLAPADARTAGQTLVTLISTVRGNRS